MFRTHQVLNSDPVVCVSSMPSARTQLLLVSFDILVQSGHVGAIVDSFKTKHFLSVLITDHDTGLKIGLDSDRVRILFLIINQ